MARTRSLTQLLDDVRWQADQLGATLRNDDTHLTRALNQSIQRFREWASENGYPHYLVSQTGTLTVGPGAGVSYGTIDASGWNPSLVHIKALEINVSNRIINLSQIPWESRNDYQGHLLGQFVQPLVNGIPVGFFSYGTTLGIVPAPQSAYPYTAWYLPLPTDLVSGSDTFDGIAGWEEWVVWDCLVKLIVRDMLPQQFAMATSERDRLKEECLQRFKMDRPSVTRRRDDRGRRKGSRGIWR